MKNAPITISTQGTDLAEKIDSAILEIFPYMISTGVWPFVMLRIDQDVVSEYVDQSVLKSSSLLLFCLRNDFDKEDLLDFAKNSKEYNSLAYEYREPFLKSYLEKGNNPMVFSTWMESITGIGIGMAIQFGRINELTLEPTEINLEGIHLMPELQSKNLMAYQLFNVLPDRQDQP